MDGHRPRIGTLLTHAFEGLQMRIKAPPGMPQSKPHRLLLIAIGELDTANRFAHYPLAQIASGFHHPMDGNPTFPVKRAIRGLHKYGLIKGAAGKYGLTPHGRRLYERMIPSRWVTRLQNTKKAPPRRFKLGEWVRRGRLPRDCTLASN